MQAVLDSFVAGFPILLLHSSVTIAILVAGVLLYIWITPWDEMSLIRAGNTAASISLGGCNHRTGPPPRICNVSQR